MSECHVKNIDPDILAKLNSMAKKHGMSRNRYMVGVLTNHALAPETKSLDERYQELFKIVLDSLEANSQIMHEILVELQGEKNDTETFYDGR